MANTLYEYNAGTADDYLRISSTVYRSQNFTPQTTHYLTGVELMFDIYGAGTPAGTTLTVEIKAVDGANKPTGAVLASGTLPCANITATESYHSILLTTGDEDNPFLQVVEDTMYAIIVRTDGDYDADHAYTWSVDVGGGGYAYGSTFQTTDGGSTWTDQAPAILMFKEYGSTTLVELLCERLESLSEDFGSFGGTVWRGETFTPTVTHTAYGASIACIRKNSLEYGDFTASIYETSEGLPTGSPICTGSIGYLTLGTNTPRTFTIVPFTTNPRLAAGTMYALVFSAPDATDVSLEYDMKLYGGYGGGTRILSPNSGIDWATDAEDLMFREFGATTKFYNLDTSVGEFALTGVNIGLLEAKWYALTASVGEFILTGINTIITFTQRWTYKSKNSTSYTNKTKNTSTYTNKSKNDSSWSFKNKS
jgi:hypothetical protein